MTPDHVRLSSILAISFTLCCRLAVADFVEGFTEPYRTVEISVGEPGRIAQIAVKPGQHVATNQLLMSLDSSVLEATLAVAKQKAESAGHVQAAQAELALSRDRRLQVAQLRERGHATQRELKRAETDLAVAEARLQLAQEEQQLNRLDCKRIEAQISIRKIKSPYDGVISEVLREVGESLIVTDPRVMTLVQLDRLRTRFSATPRQAASLRPQQPVTLVLDDTGEAIPGTVEHISPIIDAKSGTLEVHVVVQNKQRKWRSGVRCTMEVDSEPANLSPTATRPPTSQRLVDISAHRSRPHGATDDAIRRSIRRSK